MQQLVVKCGHFHSRLVFYIVYCYKFYFLLMMDIAKSETFKNFAILSKALLFLIKLNKTAEHSVPKSFLNFSENCWQPIALHKCDTIVRLINTPLRIYCRREMQANSKGRQATTCGPNAARNCSLSFGPRLFFLFQ